MYIDTFYPNNGGHLGFTHVLSSNWVRQWIPHVWKHRKSRFIQVYIMFSKKYMDIYRFYTPRWRLSWISRFWGISSYFSTWHTADLYSAPLKTPKSLYAKNLHKMPPSLLICIFSEILPSLKHWEWIRVKMESKHINFLTRKCNRKGFLQIGGHSICPQCVSLTSQYSYIYLKQ